MKLIRLTKQASSSKESDQLIFDTKFNEDIIIKKKSKVAFHSCFFDQFLTTLFINDSNNLIEYSVGTESVHISLNKGEYGPLNYNDFFIDFTNKINQSLPYNVRSMGRTFLMQINNDNKVEINFNRGYIDPSRLKLKNVNLVNGLYNATSPIVSNDNYVYNEYSWCKGVGYFRCSINNYSNGDNFILGMQKIPIDSTKNIKLGDIAYGIKVNGSLNGRIYSYWNGYQWIDYSGLTVNNKDYVEIRRNKNKIEYVVYRGSPTTTTILYTMDNITINESLYGYILFNDDVMGVKDIQFSEESYPTKTIINHNPYVNYDIESDLVGLAPTPAATTTLRIDFTNDDNTRTDELGVILGFQSQMNDGEIALLGGNKVQIIGSVKFFNKLIKYLYSVRLHNIPINSYDTDKEGRSNIIYTINSETTGENFYFTAPYPLWLDINNSSDLYLRNIKCDILEQDNSISPFVGKAILTLLIKDEDE